MLLAALLATVGVVLAQEFSSPVQKKGSQPESIPLLGFGTWQIKTNATEAVAAAIENGYRHIDCAYAYQNQKEIALGIKEGLKRTGLSRSDLWITSKLWNSRHGNADYAIKETLAQLQLDYLDLFLVHWPQGNRTGTLSFDVVDVSSWLALPTHY
jgi:alcohol dehydrogenase (NADP+)